MSLFAIVSQEYQSRPMSDPMDLKVQNVCMSLLRCVQEAPGCWSSRTLLEDGKEGRTKGSRRRRRRSERWIQPAGKSTYIISFKPLAIPCDLALLHSKCLAKWLWPFITPPDTFLFSTVPASSASTATALASLCSTIALVPLKSRFPCLAGAAQPCASVPIQQLTTPVPVLPSFAALSLGKVYAAPTQGANQPSAGPSGTPCAGFKQTALSPTLLAHGPLTLQRLMLQPVTGVPATEQVMGTENPST